ncbi:hypothetical protein GPALN_013364 [Globodera pallida]|nr:hypothetical protein GPALN_013364 [Globodera pallida]
MLCICSEGQICDECQRKRRVQEVNSRKKIVQNCPDNHFHPGMNALKASNPDLFKLAYRRVTSVINKIIDAPESIPPGYWFPPLEMGVSLSLGVVELCGAAQRAGCCPASLSL